MLKTREVLQKLNMTHHNLYSILRSGKIPQPTKDCSGDFSWSPEDVERVRAVLAARRKAAKKGGG